MHYSMTDAGLFDETALDKAIRLQNGLIESATGGKFDGGDLAYQELRRFFASRTWSGPQAREAEGSPCRTRGQSGRHHGRVFWWRHGKSARERKGLDDPNIQVMAQPAVDVGEIRHTAMKLTCRIAGQAGDRLPSAGQGARACKRRSETLCAMRGSGLFLMLRRLSVISMAKYCYVLFTKIGNIIVARRLIWRVDKPGWFEIKLWTAVTIPTETRTTTTNMTLIEGLLSTVNDIAFTLHRRKFQLS